MTDSGQLVFDDGVAIRNPGDQDVADSMAEIRGRVGAGFLMGPCAGCYLAVHADSPDAFCVEFFWESGGSIVECRQKSLPFDQVVEMLITLIAQDVEAIKRLDWQKYTSPAGVVVRSRDDLYYRSFGGDLDSIPVAEAMASLRKTRIVEWILWLATAGPMTVLVWGLKHDSGPDKFLIAGLLVIVVLIGLGIHAVNWRCPACGKALGPLPRRQCRCTWLEREERREQG